MKKITGLCFLLLLSVTVFAQDKSEAKKPLYDVTADPFAQIGEAVKRAETEQRHILVQVGGNWCVWCLRFNKFTTEDKQIDSLLRTDYVVVHINYSKENKNMPFMEKYGRPDRFGFPVFMILDEKGRKLHIQDSSFLEEGKGYSKEKIMRFLQLWNEANVPD